MKENYFNVGKVVNTHGVRGEVRIISTTDFDERFAPGHTLYFFNDQQSEPVVLTVHSHRKHKQFDLLTFEDRDSINDVEWMKGGYLKVAAEDQQDLDDDEFYYHEIIGCEVYLTDDTYIGHVKEILSPGANDVWVVQRHGLRDALIPYIEQIVKQVNVKDKKIIIENMEGLLSE